jgi:hypothetical protein
MKGRTSQPIKKRKINQPTRETKKGQILKNPTKYDNNNGRIKCTSDVHMTNNKEINISPIQ